MRELKKELWPHRVRLESDWTHEINPIETWLGERLGPFRGRWNAVYLVNHTDFYFRSGEDATLFALKWS